MRGPHDPIRIERAEGPWLYASDGNKILDAGAGAVVVNIGQGRREIAEVAARTIANLDYIVPVWTSPEREKLVDRLTRWTPAGLTRFFFTSGGSEAVEAALKFAILIPPLCLLILIGLMAVEGSHTFITRWGAFAR